MSRHLRYSTSTLAALILTCSLADGAELTKGAVPSLSFFAPIALDGIELSPDLPLDRQANRDFLLASDDLNKALEFGRGVGAGMRALDEVFRNRQGGGQDQHQHHNHPHHQQPYQQQYPPQHRQQYPPQYQQQYTPPVQQAPPPQPAAPPQPKPISEGPISVRSIIPNSMVMSPVLPPASARKIIMNELNAVVTSQVDRINELLTAAGISQASVREFITRLERSAGAGGDADLVRDLKVAVAKRDVETIEDLGLALGLSDEDLEVPLLASYSKQLQKAVEDAEDPDDYRATQDVAKSANKFSRRLNATGFEDAFKAGVTEKLQTVVALLTVRQELSQLSDESTELKWPSGEVWILATAELEPGAVYYATRELVVAGSSVKGPVTVLKSTVAAALGSLHVESAAQAQAVRTLEATDAVAFVNPLESRRKFNFTLNGYAYTLEPGTMYKFKSKDNKPLKFRYRGSNDVTYGLDLEESDTKQRIKGAYFQMSWNGTDWAYSRESQLALVGTALPALTTPDTHLFNDTNRTVTFKFDGRQHTLPAQRGQAFDNVGNWRIESNFASGKPAYALAAGKSYIFHSTNGGTDLKTAPDRTLTIDNSLNQSPFSFAIGGKWQTIPPREAWQQSFKVPPGNLAITYDRGDASLVTLALDAGTTYRVGLNSALQFALATDQQSLGQPLDVERAAFIARDNALIALADTMSEQRKRAKPVELGGGPVEPVAVPADPGEGLVEPQAQSVEIPANALPTRRPAAHVLAFGVSTYSNPEWNLKYASRDAQEFTEAFVAAADAGEQGLFREVSSKVLINDEATSDNVLKAFDRLTGEVDKGDLVILFMAAHGFSDDNRYYFGTHDLDIKNPISTAIKHADIAEVVRMLRKRDCRVLVLADTCNGGALGEDLRVGARSISNQTVIEALKDFEAANSGCILFAGASDGRESEERDEWQHGAFTKALLDTLRDPDAAGEDGMLYVEELVAGVRKSMRILTNNEQRPAVDWPSDIGDFPLLSVSTGSER